MQSDTVSTTVVQAALRGACARDVDIAPLLAAAGLDPAVLADPGARVSMRHFGRVVRAVGERLDDDLLGLTPVPVPWGAFAMMCQAAVHAGTLHGALRRLRRFYQLQPLGPVVLLEPTPDGLAVGCDDGALADPDGFATAFGLAFAHRFCSWLIGREVPLCRVEFRRVATEALRDFVELLPIEPVFGAERSALVVPWPVLGAPVVRTEDALREVLSGTPDCLFPRGAGTSTVAEQVRRVLRQSFGGAPPSVDEVASALFMSQATLRRRLAEERMSFTEIRDGLQRQFATAALGSGSTSVTQLSEYLGFSEPSAFRRAFRRWTGVSPSSYRGRELADAARAG